MDGLTNIQYQNEKSKELLIIGEGVHRPLFKILLQSNRNTNEEQIEILNKLMKILIGLTFEDSFATQESH